MAPESSTENQCNRQALPPGPESLSFNPEDFMKDDFTVDKFIASHRQFASLEALRDDMGTYLKVLRSAMIELINQDYADFVNLSTNLVGMDKAIDRLTRPLGQLKEEVLSVKTSLDTVISSLEEQLRHRKEIEDQKALLQRLQQILLCVSKIERLLGIDNESTEKCQDLSGNMVERTATELNLLHFHVAKCQGVSLVESIRPRIARIGSILQSSLQQTFLESLTGSGDVESLRRCLRIYAMVDKIQDVEQLFRREVVAPYMEEVISEAAIRSDPNGLKGMYRNVLDFVPQKCKLLQEATRGSANNEAIQGYDFIVNTGWPEVVEGLEARAPSIFNPGNPNAFHERYLISMEFLDKWERLCGSVASVKRLRDHPAYSQFMSHWNLAVYYQIRYQEIAGNLERCMSCPWAEAPRDSSFQLLVSHTLWQCLQTCWSDDVFLTSLTHRFWKLSMQLLSRFTVWVHEMSDSQKKTGAKDSSISTSVHVSASSPNLHRMNGRDLSRPMSSPSLHDSTHVSGVLRLLMDIQHLEHDLPSFVDDCVKNKLPAALQEDIGFLNEGMSESIAQLHDHITSLNKLVVKEVSSLCLMHVRQVTDIPRLYRKTNREPPSKSSQYVVAILRPVELFLEENAEVMNAEQRAVWLKEIITAVASQYHIVTNEVLVSVEKMEKSLKRLKKARDKVSSMAQGDSPRGMTDDDKIRQQLWLDVSAFTQQVETLGVDRELESIRELLDLVEKSATS